MPETKPDENAEAFIQRMKDLGVYESDKPVEPKTVPLLSESPTVTPGASMVKQLTPADTLILSFKNFLHKNGLYNGDITDPMPDDQFVAAIRNLENSITTQLRSVSPTAATLQGVIWQGDHINPKTSVEDILKAIQLIERLKRKKVGQATVDTFDVEEYQTQQPVAVKPNPTQDDYGLETGDPLDTQQIGIFRQKIPSELPVTGKEQTMDERIFGLTDLLSRLSG